VESRDRPNVIGRLPVIHRIRVAVTPSGVRPLWLAHDPGFEIKNLRLREPSDEFADGVRQVGLGDERTFSGQSSAGGWARPEVATTRTAGQRSGTARVRSKPFSGPGLSTSVITA
jgi:hypothetical protein